MHWLSVTLIVILVVVLLAMVGFFAYAVTRKPSEPDYIAGNDGFFSFPSELEYENISPEQLQRELHRVISQPLEQPAATNASSNNAVRLLNHIQANTGDPQLHYEEESGIVICADGVKYTTCAYVLISELRRQGCTLPIEVWHRNEALSADMQKLYEEMNCTVRNLDAIASINIPNEYAVKPLAVLYSRFRKVMLLDADNVVAKDPTYLFELLEEHPAVFWMNHWRLNNKAECYNVLTTEQKQKVDFLNCQDGGEMLIDKQKCLTPLHVCTKIALHMKSQLHRIFPEKSSKDCNIWHFSWIIKGVDFLMMPHRPAGVGMRNEDGKYIGNTMAQYDQNEDIVFLHKCYTNWFEAQNKPQWAVIQKFNLPKRGRVDKWTKNFQEGGVEVGLFADKFGDLEEKCWDHLRHLRSQAWYQELCKA